MVKTTFDLQYEEGPSEPMLQQLIMTPVKPKKGLMKGPFNPKKHLPITSFYPDGTYSYTNKINGHFIWDVAPERCDPGCSCDEEDSDSDEDYPLSSDDEVNYPPDECNDQKPQSLPEQDPAPSVSMTCK